MSQPKVKHKCQPREQVVNGCAICGAESDILGIFEPNAAFAARMGWNRSAKPVLGVAYSLCLQCHQLPTVAADVERLIAERMRIQ